MLNPKLKHHKALCGVLNRPQSALWCFNYGCFINQSEQETAESTPVIKFTRQETFCNKCRMTWRHGLWWRISFTSLHCTGKYELNKLTSLPMCGFTAQLVEHRTDIRGGHGFESRWSPDFFRLLLSSCLNWKIYCDDHSSLHLQPQYKYELFHISFTLGIQSNLP